MLISTFSLEFNIETVGNVLSLLFTIEDKETRAIKLDELENTHEEWKLRAMGTGIGCHTVIKKGMDGISVKLNDLT